MVPMRDSNGVDLSINLSAETDAPLTFIILSPATWERKSPNRATTPRWDLLSP